MLTRVNLKTARNFTLTALKAGLVPFVAGSPGLGKTAMMRSIAKELNLKLITVHLSQEDPTCLNGLFNFDEGRTKVFPTDRFPIEDMNVVEEGYEGWLIFFDEVNAVPKSVQAAAYRIILDREIGEHKLHEKAMVCAAGNLVTDGAAAIEMGTAFRSRMVHIHVETDPELFLDVAPELNFDPRAIAYMNYQKGKINNFKNFGTSEDETFACERTWEFASNLTKQVAPEVSQAIPLEFLAMFQGTLGSTGIEYVQFTQAMDGLPTYQAIVKNPETTSLPDRPAVLWLLVAMLAGTSTEKDLDAIVTYIKRIPLEFQFSWVKFMCKQHVFVYEHDGFCEIMDKITGNLYE